MKSNFFELGGNSLNSVVTVAQLRDRGYYIGITDFINAVNLEEILNIICDSDSSPTELFVIKEVPGLELNCISITNENKAEYIELSF